MGLKNGIDEGAIAKMMIRSKDERVLISVREERIQGDSQYGTLEFLISS